MRGLIVKAWCIYFKYEGKCVPFSRLQVFYVEEEDLARYMREDRVSKIKDLSCNDCIYFDNEDEADEYLETYKKYYKILLKNNFCLDRSLPCLMFPRHNLVQIIAGLKTSTRRAKLWGRMGRIKKNEFFNATDRTHFVTCRARDIVYGKTMEVQLAFSFMAE